MTLYITNKWSDLRAHSTFRTGWCQIGFGVHSLACKCVLNLLSPCVQPMSEGQDVKLFVDPRGRLMYSEVRSLKGQDSFLEAAGYVQINCNLPAEAPGHKTCAHIDFRASLHCTDGSKPIMLIQQIKGIEGKGFLEQQVCNDAPLFILDGQSLSAMLGLLPLPASQHGIILCRCPCAFSIQAVLAWQGLEQWLGKLDCLRPLEEKYELVYVYITKQRLGRDGWMYAAKKQNLLLVPRQTMPTYLPVIQDRLALNDLALPPSED